MFCSEKSGSVNIMQQMCDINDIETRQKKERKALLVKCQKLKHETSKGDKRRKKEVMEQIAAMEHDLNDVHCQELESARAVFQQMNENSVESDILVKHELLKSVGEQIGSNECDLVVNGKETSRAQRRRDKKSAKERERESQIRDEAGRNLLGPRHREYVKLQSLLSKRQLAIHEVSSDGNCLFSAVKHQLDQRGIVNTIESLRQMTTDTMRDHSQDYLPFMTHLDTGGLYTEEEFYQHCTKMTSTAVWGGQVEIKALSTALSVPMEVVQAEGSNVTIGEEFSGLPIILVYHRHAFELGEHYNSVEPNHDDNNDVD